MKYFFLKFKYSDNFTINFTKSEFKLTNTKWENQIIEEFLKANTEPSSPESLRLTAFNNLEKYFLSCLNKQLKDEILIELLRSAAYEISRVNIFTNLLIECSIL
jgi:hypothetical protein